MNGKESLRRLRTGEKKSIISFRQSLKKETNMKKKENVTTPGEEFSWTQEFTINDERDPFLHSLKTLQPEDIPLSYEKPKKTKEQKRADFMSNLLLYACIGVFLVSCVLLADNLLQKKKGNAEYDEVASDFADLHFDIDGMDDPMADSVSAEQVVALKNVSPLRSDSMLMPLSENIQEFEQAQNEDVQVVQKTDANTAQLEKLRAVLRSYKERNPDVFGYIRIPNVGIDYVMVQGEDNDFYLEHNYKKEYLVIGSIFVDYHCYKDMSENFNTVLYGHNIVTGDGAMFHGVTKFLEEDVFRSELIYIYTMDGVFVYKPFSVYDTTATSGYIRTGFLSKQDFAEFCAEMKGRSKFDSDIVVGEEDRIITLSTCTNVGDGRYALHAVLINSMTG